MAARKQPLRSLAEVGELSGRRGSEWVFAYLQRCERRSGSRGDPYFELLLADAEATVAGRIWGDAAAAMKAAAKLRHGDVVKVAFEVETWQGRPQLKVQKIAPADPDDEGFDPVRLFGEVPDWVLDVRCRTLVFDIETVPAAEIRKLPQTIVKSLTEHAERRDVDQSEVMGLSPFLGKVVSLAFGDGDRDPREQRVTVMVVPPDGSTRGLPDWVEPVSEPELLRAFWALAARAETVVTFNGKGFDVPFLMARSVVHGIPTRVDLLSQRFGLRPHLDLLEVLSQRQRGPSSLDVVCWALGIQSPKGTMDGSMVAPAYHRGEIAEIAEYNRNDVRATTAVFHRVRDLVLRFRQDWP